MANDPGFPVGGHQPSLGGGTNLQRGHFSAKTYVKTEELCPVGCGQKILYRLKIKNKSIVKYLLLFLPAGVLEFLDAKWGEPIVPTAKLVTMVKKAVSGAPSYTPRRMQTGKISTRKPKGFWHSSQQGSHPSELNPLEL